MREIWADEMIPDTPYIRPGDPVGIFFTLHPRSRSELLQELEAQKGNISGRNTFWLAKLRRNDELIPVMVHSKYMDSSSGGEQRSAELALLDPTTELHSVGAEPPCPSKFPCWCPTCQAQARGEEDEEDEEEDEEDEED